MTKKEPNGFVLAADNWVNKSNALNEVRNNRMTLSQMRLFTIYLSKINPMKKETREVTFNLEEYTRIMQFKQTNTTRLIKTAEDLLGLTVKYLDKTGEYSSDGLKGFVMCQIFKRFKLHKNDDGEWLVSIDCHDDVLHLMFDLQKYYFKYELWNALQLTSFNQQRMYELLKQYEKAGERIVSIKDLREWLGLKPAEYTVWQNFKKRVLDASQAALTHYTDIKFTWEVYGKRGQGGKIKALKFTIEKNTNYLRQLTLDDFYIEQGEIEFEEEPEEFERPDHEIEVDEYGVPYDDNYIDGKSPYMERIEFFMMACNEEFSFEEMETINNKLRELLTPDEFNDQIFCYHYIGDRYQDMNRQSRKKEVGSRFGLVKFLMDKKI